MGLGTTPCRCCAFLGAVWGLCSLCPRVTTPLCAPCTLRSRGAEQTAAGHPSWSYPNTGSAVQTQLPEPGAGLLAPLPIPVPAGGGKGAGQTPKASRGRLGLQSRQPCSWRLSPPYTNGSFPRSPAIAAWDTAAYQTPWCAAGAGEASQGQDVFFFLSFLFFFIFFFFCLALS